MVVSVVTSAMSVVSLACAIVTTGMTVATTVATTGIVVVSSTIRFGYGFLRERWRSAPAPAAELKEEPE